MSDDRHGNQPPGQGGQEFPGRGGPDPPEGGRPDLPDRGEGRQRAEPAADQPDYFLRLPEQGPPPPTGRDGRGHAWLLLLCGAVASVVAAMGLVAWLGGAPDSTSIDQPSAASSAAPTEAATVPASPPAVRERRYAVWATNDDGSPVRWNPCDPIRWVFDPTHAPEGAKDDIVAAMRQITSATGLGFRFAGQVDERPRRDRSPFQPDRYGSDRWAPVLIAWAPVAETDVSMSDSDRAVAIPVAVGNSAHDVFVSGQIVLNADKKLPSGFGDRHASWGATVLHELGHLVGLDHVEDPRELMFAYPGFGPVEFGPGDLAGLAAVGADGGCLSVPRPAAVQVTYQEDFGN